jgi:hypothetical protein
MLKPRLERICTVMPLLRESAPVPPTFLVAETGSSPNVGNATASRDCYRPLAAHSLTLAQIGEPGEAR